MSNASSGVREGIKNKIKLVKRQGYGFRNFKNFRLRLLAAFSSELL
ncbi:transposase [Laspinema olomoucense]|nr:transposase [Laspinema sp. D3d]MCT7975679.1 transposase [Laspinema sp. D3d]